MRVSILRQIKKSEKGFTLIEVMIALLILGIIVIGTTGGLTQAAKTAYYTNCREQAKNVAETQMEYVRNSPYSLTSYTPYTPPSPPSYWGNYISTISISAVPGNSDLNIQKITVTVGYTNVYTGAAVNTVLEDYKANK
jgi:prepilin-type N-terminal cleavage/methylation domain-containing protein